MRECFSISEESSIIRVTALLIRQVNAKRAKGYVKIHIRRRQYLDRKKMRQYIVNNDAIIELTCRLNMSGVRKVDEAHFERFYKFQKFTKYHHIKYV